MPHVQDVFHDVSGVVTDDTNDLQTTCLNAIESTKTIQQMNMPSTNACHEDISTKNDEVVLNDYQFDDNVPIDCSSHSLEQVVELVNVTDKTMVDLAFDQNKITSSIDTSTEFTTSTDDKYISDEHKALCNKILLSNTIVISRTKLNKVCKINMKDAEKACQILIDNDLLSLETNVLGNRHSYYESFLKQIPQNQSQLMKFSLTLAKFGIDNIKTYYDTLTIIDTQNATYLTPYGHSLLQKSYSNLNVKMNESAIIQPTKNHCRRFFNLSNDGHSSDEENLSMVKTGQLTNADHPSESSNTTSKRRRGLIGKGKQYQEETKQSKKKNKDDH